MQLSTAAITVPLHIHGQAENFLFSLFVLSFLRHTSVCPNRHVLGEGWNAMRAHTLFFTV